MMKINLKQFNSLCKIRNLEEIDKTEDIYQIFALKGEQVSYQIVISSETDRYRAKCELESSLNDYIKLYQVEDAVMDYTTKFDDGDYITVEKGTMPDILTPIEVRNSCILIKDVTSLWVNINIPEDVQAGTYPVKIRLTRTSNGVLTGCETVFATMNINVLNAVMPKQTTMFTQWFYNDCIASVHKTEIYSEKHWELIDKYMSMANSTGINMLLTPVITPPVNVAKGYKRPNVQLVDIKYDNKYTFDFAKLKRWINLCRKNKIKYFEISPLFSQWGLKYTPNIQIEENGVLTYKFGWHKESDHPEYVEFLNAFIPELMKVIKEEGIEENTYFHISDEPCKSNFENYKRAYSIIKPLIGNCKIIDACSDYEYYKEGLIDIPVPIVDHVEPYIENNIKDWFVYTSCYSTRLVGNRLMSMPAYRNRILGLQMYKFNITGFLHWGYNFYYTAMSEYEINPYVSTSADGFFPSGDSFSVYPGNDGPLYSTRALVFKDALQDIEVCKKLEKYIGKENVIKLMEDMAGMEITFTNYPRNIGFIISLMDQMKKIIEAKENQTDTTEEYCDFIDDILK